MNQIGTMGTTLLKASRARRKVPVRKVMRLVPEVVRAAPDDKLSLFDAIPNSGGAVLKSLRPGSKHLVTRLRFATCPLRSSASRQNAIIRDATTRSRASQPRRYAAELR